MSLLKVLVTTCSIIIISACAIGSSALVTDIRGKEVDPDTLMCKSIGEIGEFSGGNAISSTTRTKRVSSSDLLAAAKKMGATHIRWTSVGKLGTPASQSGEAYRCIYQTRKFRKKFATNILLQDQ